MGTEIQGEVSGTVPRKTQEVSPSLVTGKDIRYGIRCGPRGECVYDSCFRGYICNGRQERTRGLT